MSAAVRATTTMRAATVGSVSAVKARPAAEARAAAKSARSVRHSASSEAARTMRHSSTEAAGSVELRRMTVFESASAAARETGSIKAGSALKSATSRKSALCKTAAESRTARITAPSPVAGTAIEPAAIVPVEPWPGTDENAADKPIGAVVTVRSASIRRIIVIAVETIRWTVSVIAGVSETDANPNTNLSLRGRNCEKNCYKTQNCKHREISQMTHLFSPEGSGVPGTRQTCMPQTGAHPI